MTNPADHSAADGAAMRHTLTVQETSPSSPHPEPEQSPAGGELERYARDLGGVANLLEHRMSTETNLERENTRQAAKTCRDVAAALARQAPAPSGVEAVERVLAIAEDRHKREMEKDPFDSGFIALKHFVDAVRQALRPPAPSGRDEREDQSLAWLLRLIVAMGGRADASDYKGCWVHAFCDDGEPDTFNRAIDLGLTRSSHCTSFDTTTVEITDAGRAYLDAILSRQAASAAEKAEAAFSDAQGVAWFERTFGVPLGDMPGRLDVERVRASAAVLSPVGGDLENAPGTTRAATHNALPPISQITGKESA